MAEDLVLSLLQKLERRQSMISCLNFCFSCFDVDIAKERESEMRLEDRAKERERERRIEKERKVIIELKLIVDILRDKKLGEGGRLNYFMICDLVHMAHDLVDRFYGWTGDIESIHNWIEEIKTRLLKFGDDGVEIMQSSENVDDDEDEKYVVGLEEDVEMLLHTWIIDGKGYDTWIVLIKGMSGIGKTTLAREIFNHATVIKEFQRRAWVSNSTHFTLKELFIKLIQQVDRENLHTSSLLEEMDNRSLLDMLCHHLQGTRYLIVLDDMPKQMHLSSFLRALPHENNGSKLLLTSHTTHRNIYVNVEDVHQMKPLDSNRSWQLFLKTINHGNKLTGEHKFPMSLEPQAKQVLRKCDGLPLAIKEVGKQLAEKKVSGGSEWERLLESVDFGSTLKLLEPFYQKLDPSLESCFLYMAVYKENITLRAEKLAQIWLARVAERGNLSEDDYKSYVLDDLANSSFIEVRDKSTEYRMNALLRRLAIEKAVEKIGFEILSNDENNQSSQSPPLHRVIICSRDKFNYSTNKDKHLVSLFFHGGGYFNASPSYWKSFEILKILDLEDFGLKILPESIGTLLALKYLGLRNNYIKELPHSLGCLKKLEVLDIALNFMLELPDIILELHSLRHLYLSDVICQKPLKIDALWFLETLIYISIDNWTYELSGLRMLARLRKLGIQELDGNSDVSKLFVSLADLKKLKHLILRGYRFKNMPCLDELGILQGLHTLKLDGLLARLPNSLPRFLESLTLVNSCLDEDPMPLLAAKLPKLEYLKMRNAYTGQQMVILHDAFRNLEVLCIEELWNLRNVLCGKGSMDRLNKLEIHDCPYLDTLPEEIRSFSYMKEIKMVTTKDIAAKIKNSYVISKIRIVNIKP